MAALSLAVASVALLAVQLARPTPALAENVTNTTIHVPASVQTNPCFPTDVINLSGDIHIVITTTRTTSSCSARATRQITCCT